MRTNDASILEAVELLFSDLPNGSVGAIEFTFTVGPDGAQFDGPDPISRIPNRDPSTVLTDLVTAVNFQMLEAGSDRLHLHAGAVAKDGFAVVISAASGQGKTTLVTTLALRGWEYLTDEATSIAADDPNVRAFPKPVSIKQTGFDILPALADYRVTVPGAESGLWHVPLGQLGVSTQPTAVPKLIVVLTRNSDSEAAAWEPLSPAEAVVHLVEQSLDLDRYGSRALAALAEFCARCQCVRIIAGTPSATAEVVEDLWTQNPQIAPTVTTIRPSGTGATLIDKQIESVRIGDEGVLRNTASGEIISLNPAALRIWENLCGFDPADTPLAQGELAFVRQLSEIGFLNESAVERISNAS